jgi:biotin transport system permease protein
MAVTPYSYAGGQSPLHRLNAGVKLLGLAAFSAAAFFANPYVCAALTALLAALSAVARVRPDRLLTGCRPVLAICLFTAAARALDYPLAFSLTGLLEGLVFLWAVMLCFCAGALLFAVTTMRGLREAAYAAESVLLRPVSAILGRSIRPRIGLALSLMMGFIPRFFAVWEALKCAHCARGGRKGLAEMRLLLPAALALMMEDAARVSSALEARGMR